MNITKDVLTKYRNHFYSWLLNTSPLPTIQDSGLILLLVVLIFRYWVHRIAHGIISSGIAIHTS
jgi:hypothetical protein